MIIKLLAEGGAMQPGPALSQKLGPAGINVNQVIQKVNEATQGFKGMKVPVELDVDPSTKEIKVNVSSPPMSELVKKELGIEKGSGVHKKLNVGNMSIEQVVSVAKTKLPTTLCNDLRACVKSVVGTCVSLGVLIESKSPVEIEREIDNGVYDKQINEEITETPEEKKQELKEFYDKLRKDQDHVLKQEADAAAAKEAKK